MKTDSARKPSERLAYGDVLRILGTIAVVFLHVAAEGVTRPSAVLPGEWWISNVVDSACRWAVPVFVMLSGALLLSPDRSVPPREFYIKRLRRIGVPLVFWCATYGIWRWIYQGDHNLVGLVRSFIFGNPYYHLYFLFVMVGLYLFTPMLQTWVRFSSRRRLLFLSFLFLLLASADALVRCVVGYEYSVFFKFIPYVGYYCIGYYFCDLMPSRRILPWLMGTFVLMVTVVAAGTYVLLTSLGTQRAFILYDYFSLPVMVMSVCVFMLVKTLSDLPSMNKLINNCFLRGLASTTFGIYLVHPIVWDLLQSNRSIFSVLSTWIKLPISAVSVLLISGLLVLLIQRVPWLRQVVG